MPTEVTFGVTGDTHLTWRRGSVLSKLTDGKADAASELTRLAREMRDAFDQKQLKELEGSLKLVTDAAGEMGVPVLLPSTGQVGCDAIDRRFLLRRSEPCNSQARWGDHPSATRLLRSANSRVWSVGHFLFVPDIGCHRDDFFHATGKGGIGLDGAKHDI